MIIFYNLLQVDNGKKKNNLPPSCKKAFEKLRNLNNKIKKFNLKIKIKGDNSMLDSVDTITFFSLLDSEIQKNKLKNPKKVIEIVQSV